MKEPQVPSSTRLGWGDDRYKGGSATLYGNGKGAFINKAAVVAGLGSWIPPRIVSNEELSERLATSAEWIRTRTGIRQRRVVDPGMSTADLAVEAGRRAMQSAGTSQVGAVVLATTTPDYLCPATAPEVASRLGQSGVAALDIGAVCTGFIYALATGAGLISIGVADWVLVIGADTFSTIVDPKDRTTTAIFGDGAGAVVLRTGYSNEPGALGLFDLGSDGELAGLITIPAGGSRQRSTGVAAPAADHYFQMQGKVVFKSAVLRMAESAHAALRQASWRTDQVDQFVGHQANARILGALANEIGISPDRIVCNIDKVGNTAAASIPLALADAARDGRLKANQRVLLTAFGGGLTWGSTTLIWPDIKPI
jgi:3-oxoacyl-(acyl-carrier-protein) synthase III